MKIFKIIILILLVGLGVSSGLAKIMLIPGEMDFFKGVGFSQTLLILFGIIQLIGGILLILKKMRKIGASVIAITFFASTILIFLSGKIVFGFFSILPILLAVVIIKDRTDFTNRKVK